MTRIFLNACILISLFAFPWWITIAFMLLLLVLARAYEVLLWGFLLDVLYGASLPAFFGIPALGTLFSACVFILAEFIKPRLLFY